MSAKWDRLIKMIAAIAEDDEETQPETVATEGKRAERKADKAGKVAKGAPRFFDAADYESSEKGTLSDVGMLRPDGAWRKSPTRGFTLTLGPQVGAALIDTLRIAAAEGKIETAIKELQTAVQISLESRKANGEGKAQGREYTRHSRD